MEPKLEMVEKPDILPHYVFVAGIGFPNESIEMPASRSRWKDAQAKMIEPDPLTETELAALNSGKAYLAAYGRITYDDVFGAHHWTKFCKWLPVSQGSYQAVKCTEYNDTDNN